VDTGTDGADQLAGICYLCIPVLLIINQQFFERQLIKPQLPKKI